MALVSRSGAPPLPFVDEGGQDLFSEGPRSLTDVGSGQQQQEQKTAVDVDMVDGPAPSERGRRSCVAGTRGKR